MVLQSKYRHKAKSYKQILFLIGLLLLTIWIMFEISGKKTNKQLIINNKPVHTIITNAVGTTLSYNIDLSTFPDINQTIFAIWVEEPENVKKEILYQSYPDTICHRYLSNFQNVFQSDTGLLNKPLVQDLPESKRIILKGKFRENIINQKIRVFLEINQFNNSSQSELHRLEADTLIKNKTIRFTGGNTLQILDSCTFELN